MKKYSAQFRRPAVSGIFIFKKVGESRYQVIRKDAPPRKTTSRAMTMPGFVGTVMREEYMSSIGGKKAVKREIWIPYTPGYIKVPGFYTTRQAAAEALGV